MVQKKDNKKGKVIVFGESVTAKIRKRAEELYKRRGSTPGNDWADWFEAEREIKQELRENSSR